MKKLSFLLLIGILLPVSSPIVGSFHLVKKYTYQSENGTANLRFEDIKESTASTAQTKSQTFWKRATGTVGFTSDQNMFTMKIPKTFAIKAGDNPIRASFAVNGKNFPLDIDLDSDEREEDFYYTQPFFLDKTSRVSYIIEAKSSVQIASISIMGLDTDAHNLHIAFSSDIAEAANSTIIKRSEWGADETLRYADSPRWKPIYDKLEADKDKPKSDATLKYEAKIQAIASHLAMNFPDQDKAIERTDSEDGHPLVWPIEKTKQVERIVIHHTAENSQTSVDDLTMMRGIYGYHALQR